MSHIFVSYRREDSNWATDRLIARLRERFGRDAIFHDVDGIEPGRDFREVLEERLSSCSVLLAVIGEQWVGAIDRDGSRRLSKADDWVRIELESGLAKKDVVVIPVVIRPAEMPRANELPASLADFCYRQEVAIFPGGDFEVGFQKLATTVDKILRSKGLEVGSAEPRSEGRSRALGQNPIRVGVSIALATVAVIVGAVFLLTRNLGPQNIPRRTLEQATSADRTDLDRVVKRFVGSPVPPDRDSKIEERQVEALGQPDYSNFEFRFDERIWSFSDFHPEAITDSSSYQSAMVTDRTLLVVKTAPVKQLRFQARTTGRDLIFSPKAGSPPSHVETDGILVDTGIYRTQAKHLCFDVSEYEVNQEFTISYRTSYWDAPEEEEPWFGAMSYPGCLRLKVIAVGSGPGFFDKLERKKCSSFDSPLEDCADGQWVITEDDSAFLWNMPNPEPFKIYMFYF